MLSRQEWSRTAEYQAARAYGEKYASWFMFRRFLAGPLGILVLAGILGGGAYWLWGRMHVPSAGPGHLPTAFWVLTAALALGTFIAFRPTQAFRPAAVLLLRGVVTALLWLGFATYAVVALV